MSEPEQVYEWKDAVTGQAYRVWRTERPVTRSRWEVRQWDRWERCSGPEAPYELIREMLRMSERLKKLEATGTP